jgi:hypothetical protein
VWTWAVIASVPGLTQPWKMDAQNVVLCRVMSGLDRLQILQLALSN